MSFADTTQAGTFAGAGTPPRSGVSAKSAQAALVLIVCTATAAGLAAGHSPHAVAQAGPELTRLLRAMAAMKVVIALGAIAATLWRVQSPVGALRFALYAAAGAAMAAGPGLIWGMAHVALGAFLLHAGLIASVLLLWRDPEIARRLDLLVAAKRAALRP